MRGRLSRSRWRLLTGVLLGILGARPLAASAAGFEVTYAFAPVNQYSLEVMARYWNPILEYVSANSGVRLELRLGRTSAETTAQILAGHADFAFTNHLFSPERVRLGWRVFGRRDASPVHGQVVVAADSPFQRLTDLRGESVGFPGVEAFVSYKVTLNHLQESQVSITPVFAGNLDAAFTQMFAGRVAAVGTNSQMASEYAVREGRQFRVLWSSPPFNDLALMASPRVPPAHVRAVAKAFLRMRQDPVGRGILNAAADVVKARDPIAFVSATDADYSSYREFYRRLSVTPR